MKGGVNLKCINEMRKNSTKKDFIVDNLMKSNGLYCLVARPKVGKSLLALQLANAIATGTNFLGFRTSPSPVLYIRYLNFSNIFKLFLNPTLVIWILFWISPILIWATSLSNASE